MRDRASAERRNVTGPEGEVARTAITGTRYRRAPFLLVEWQGDSTVVVDCDSQRRFRVDLALLTLLSHLDQWRSHAEIEAAGHLVTTDDLGRLSTMGIVETASGGSPQAGIVETASGGPSQPGIDGSSEHRRASATSGHYWNPYDLAVHRSSNRGGFREDAVRARGVAAPPIEHPRPDGAVTPLPTPAEALPETFGAVLRRRRSLRLYADRPLPLSDLSTLLHHSARIDRVFRHELLGEQALRPFPAGGARSELEIYVIAEAVDGLAPGAHYFDPRQHDLVQVRERDGHQGRLLRSVHAATGGALNRDPPAVLLITAVFSRIMWKYEGIGLSLIHKNTGALLQTLYLVATALDLAPCALGGGEERANSSWLGLDPLVESQVGCFLVGPRGERPTP